MGFFAAAAAGLLLPLRGFCAPPPVSTIAGSGLSGFRDGPAHSAEFVMPVSLAYDSAGNLFVADAGAQRIRVIRPNGNVQTIAGSGELRASGLWVVGGFHNGAAGQARFNYPSAVAVGPDGALYVADTLNSCIRKIQNGEVTTYAGQPSKVAADDGPRSVATFRYPKALAFDAAGDLLVADYSVGVRSISPSGRISTLKLPGVSDLRLTGLAVWGNGDKQRLFVASADGVAVLDAHHDLVFRHSVNPDDAGPHVTIESGHPFGVAYSIAPLGPDEAVYSDPREHVIRYFRKAQVAIIAGRPTEDAPNTDGGYLDGDPESARFDAPMGLAVMPGGSIAVADVGNRRIRALPPVDRRGPHSHEELPRGNSGTYRIAYLGDSYAYFNTMWSDSLPGRLEARLVADRARTGLVKPPSLFVVNDLTTLKLAQAYVDRLSAHSGVDVVVWDLNPATIATSFPEDMKPRTGATAHWPALLTQAVRAMREHLAAAHIPLLVVAHPVPQEISPLETPWLSETAAPAPRAYAQLLVVHEQLIESLAASGAPVLDAYPAFLALEQAQHHTPLFGSADVHFSRSGRELMARLVGDELERRKPWWQ